VAGRWFSSGTPVTNFWINVLKFAHHETTLLLKGKFGRIFHGWSSKTYMLFGRGVFDKTCDKFVSDLWQVGGFLLVLRFSPLIKHTATI
jgi:hypothetical protein